MASFLARLWELRLSIAVGVVAFVSYFLCGGATYASGVLFNELLKRPCHEETARNSTVSSNESATCTSNETCKNELCGYTSTWAEGNASITGHSLLSDKSDCGGFGQNRGSTGKFQIKSFEMKEYVYLYST